MENAFFVSGIIFVMELYDINSLNLNKKIMFIRQSMKGSVKAEKESKEHMKNRLINTDYSPKMQKKC